MFAKFRSFSSGLAVLTHWGRDKMAAVSQTTLSNAFSWVKMLEFRLRYHWSLFLRVQLTFHHWFRQWLGAGQATSHYLNQWWLVYRRIYASLGLNELIRSGLYAAFPSNCFTIRFPPETHLNSNHTNLRSLITCLSFVKSFWSFKTFPTFPVHAQSTILRLWHAWGPMLTPPW